MLGVSKKQCCSSTTTLLLASSFSVLAAAPAAPPSDGSPVIAKETLPPHVTNLHGFGCDSTRVGTVLIAVDVPSLPVKNSEPSRVTNAEWPSPPAHATTFSSVES